VVVEAAIVEAVVVEAVVEAEVAKWRRCFQGRPVASESIRGSGAHAGLVIPYWVFT
jgi:hypothetical protein